MLKNYSSACFKYNDLVREDIRKTTKAYQAVEASHHQTYGGRLLLAEYHDCC